VPQVLAHRRVDPERMQHIHVGRRNRPQHEPLRAQYRHAFPSNLREFAIGRYISEHPNGSPRTPPMRFSFWPMPTLPFDTVLRLARHVEATGWDGIWYADHFMPNAPDTSAPWPESWITLAAIGAQVPRLRIGTLVSGNTYRHPA